MMGMGEPLMNLKQVLLAHRTLNEDLGIGGRRLHDQHGGRPQRVVQARRAHAAGDARGVVARADQALREKLVPSASAYPIEALLEDCRLYKKRRGGADVRVHAAGGRERRARAGQGAGEDASVARRPGVPREPAALEPRRGRRAPQAEQRGGASVLGRARAERGITHTVRRTRGLEADAACGQLTGNFRRATSARRAAARSARSRGRAFCTAVFP